VDGPGKRVISRRAVLCGICSPLLAAPLAARAQPAGTIYRIGFLMNAPPTGDSANQRFVGAFVRGLHETGWVEGPEHDHRVALLGRTPTSSSPLLHPRPEQRRRATSSSASTSRRPKPLDHPVSEPKTIIQHRFGAGARVELPAERGLRRTRSSVDVAAMTDLEDRDSEVLVLNLVQDAVPPLSNPKQIVAGELLAARRPRLTGQPLYPRRNASPVLRGKPFELLGRRRLDQQPIACHDAAGRSVPSQDRGWVPWPGPDTQQDPRRPLQGSAGRPR
jgi:hypothetical protein